MKSINIQLPYRQNDSERQDSEQQQLNQSSLRQLSKFSTQRVVKLKSSNILTFDFKTYSKEREKNECLKEYRCKDQEKISKIITIEDYLQQDLKYQANQWHWTIFFEFLVYHILFYFFFGPLLVLLLYKFTGRTIMINMRFWKNHSQFYFQLALWMASLFEIGQLILEDFDFMLIHELVFLWFALLLRAIVIASKYATFSLDKIRIYKTIILSEELFTFDMIMWDWRMQSPKIYFLEQYKFLQKREFDHNIYKFDFLVQPSVQTIERIKNTKIDFNKQWFYEQEIVQEGDYKIEPITDNSYNGFYLFSYLIDNYQKMHPSRTVFTNVLLQALILSLTPAMLRINHIMEDSDYYYDIITLIINFLAEFQGLCGSFIFLQIGLYDYQRKFFLLEQSLYMLSAKEVSYSTSKKLLPTINFNNPITLQAWSILRALSFDYGFTYDYRIQGFYSLIFIFWVVIFVLILGLLLSLIEINSRSLILIGEMFVVLSLFIASYLYHGAKLNYYHEEFDIVLEDVKTMYLSILRNKENYFTFGIVPANGIHQIFIDLLTEQTTNITHITEYIEFILNEVDDVIRQLHYDERHHPFKVYGVKITFNFLKSVFMAICTVVGFALQQNLTYKQMKMD